jgi:hypothetical protein
MKGEDEEKPMHPKRLRDPDMRFDAVGDKALKKVQKKAWEAGWYPKRRKNGILWQAPDEVGQVMLHGTASDNHAYANAVSEFRKAGLDV